MALLILSKKCEKFNVKKKMVIEQAHSSGCNRKTEYFSRFLNGKNTPRKWKVVKVPIFKKR